MYQNRQKATTRQPTKLPDLGVKRMLMGVQTSMVDYKNVKIVSPTPSELGGLALNNNFIALADQADALTNAIATVFPTQTGNSGKYLSTDGSSVRWTTVSSGAVSSVAGRTGAVTLTSADVGLGNVMNSLQLAALNNLSDLASAATARTNLGLGSAATMSSSAFATSSALNGYLPLTGGTITGNIAVNGTTTLDNSKIFTDGHGLMTFNGASTGVQFYTSNGHLGVQISGTNITGNPSVDSLTVNGVSTLGGLSVSGYPYATSLDGGLIGTDGSGDLTAVSFIGDGSQLTGFSFSNLFNGLTVAGGSYTTSLDSEAITSDGNGTLTAANYYSNGGITANTAVTIYGSSGLLSLVVEDGTTSLDGGAITTDGSGNIIMNGLLVQGGTTLGYHNNPTDQGLTVNGRTSLDGGGVSTDGNGNLYVTNTTSLDDGSIVTNGSGAMTLSQGISVSAASGSSSFDAGLITTDGSGNLTVYQLLMLSNQTAGITGNFGGAAISLGDINGNGNRSLFSWDDGTQAAYVGHSGGFEAHKVFDVNGNIYGNGSNLTNLSAANLTGSIASSLLTGSLPAISGASLTNLNATNLASGTVADARLSTNIPLKNATLNSFTGNLIAGHLMGTGSVSASIGTGAGTGSPSISLTTGSTDLSGQFQVNTGTSPAANAIIATITFASAYATKGPFVTLTAANFLAAQCSGTTGVYVDGSTNTKFNLKSTTSGLTASAVYIWNYTVTGQ